MKFQKEDIILLVFVGDMIVYLEKHKGIHRKTIRIINSAMPLNVMLVCSNQLYFYILPTIIKEIKSMHPKHQISRIDLMENVQEDIMREIKGLNKGEIKCIHGLEDIIKKSTDLNFQDLGFLGFFFVSFFFFWGK